MARMTHRGWLAIREGVWLNDDKDLEGLSKLPQPKPKTPPQRKRLTPAVRPTAPQVRPLLSNISVAKKNGRP